MNKRQKQIKTKVNVMTKKTRPMHLLILCTILIAMTIGVTTALIFTRSEEKTNTFTPGSISCQVQEDYSIKNASNTSAYVRAEVVVNWIDESGNVYGAIPDFELTLGDNWTKNTNDGYYYYDNIVEKDLSTDALVSNVTTNDTVPEGYTLTVTVLAEAIQATDNNQAIQNAWGVNL